MQHGRVRWANLDPGDAASLCRLWTSGFLFWPFVDTSEHFVCMAEIESSGGRKTAGFAEEYEKILFLFSCSTSDSSLMF